MLRIGLVLLIFPVVALFGGFFSEMTEVNACIRQQGSFDYVRMQCDLSAQHAFIPYFQRHPLWVNGSMIVAVMGFLCCVAGLYKGRR